MIRFSPTGLSCNCQSSRVLINFVMPSAHGLFFLIVDEKSGVKIGSCTPTFGPIINLTFYPTICLR